jgi:hypothetical protein
VRDVRGRRYGWVSILFFLATWVPSLFHDGWALTVDEVALLKGPDRQKVLEEGAKKEGKILWYSTLIVNQALRPIKEASHAPMLLIDFLISKDGQKLLQELDYLPAHPEVSAKTPNLKPGGGKFTQVNYIGPEVLFDKEQQWSDLFQKLFFK